jgi:Fungal Zn(2)-Cys(6) binuclear cluster domain
VKCDEHKPICNQCLKRSRECTYPLSSHKDPSSSGKALGGDKETIESRRHNNDSASALNFDLLDVDDRTQQVVVKFSPRGSSTTTSSINLFQSDQQILIDSRRAPINITESPYIPLSSMLPSNSAICPSEEFVRPSTNTMSTRATLQISTIPKSIQDSFVQFFINFHQRNVNEFHYFVYYDYHKFCTRTLMLMIERPNALRDAVVAFSALIYSMKIDRSARVLALLYYTSALQQLRVLLDQVTLNVDQFYMALATALQLASFDVFILSIKCADS